MNFKDYITVDLTHTLHPQVPTWSGSCGFELKIKCDYANSQDTVKFRAQKVTMHCGIGTHMDAPSHCIPGGLSIDELELSQFLVPACVIDVSHTCSADSLVTVEDIFDFEKRFGTIPAGCLVIIYTGWSRFWNDPKKYRNEDETGCTHFPSVQGDAAALLITRGVCGLAIDTLSPDTATSGYPVHNNFLSAKKYIIENVCNADKLPQTGAFVVVLPMKIKEAAEAPVRMIGFIPRAM